MPSPFLACLPHDVYAELTLADLVSAEVSLAHPLADVKKQTPASPSDSNAHEHAIMAHGAITCPVAYVESASGVRVSGILERIDGPASPSTLAGATAWLTDGAISLPVHFDAARFALAPCVPCVGDFVTVVGHVTTPGGLNRGQGPCIGISAHGVSVHAGPSCAEASAAAQSSACGEVERRRAFKKRAAYLSQSQLPLVSPARPREDDSDARAHAKKPRFESRTPLGRQVAENGNRANMAFAPSKAMAGVAVPHNGGGGAGDAFVRALLHNVQEERVDHLSQVSQEVVSLGWVAVRVGEAVRSAGIAGIVLDGVVSAVPEAGAAAVREAVKQLLAGGLAYESDGKYFGV